jgi:hypothetical protein
MIAHSIDFTAFSIVLMGIFEQANRSTMESIILIRAASGMFLLLQEKTSMMPWFQHRELPHRVESFVGGTCQTA